MNEQKNQFPVKEGDIVFCIKEAEDLVLYALYIVKGAEEINGDIVLSLETADGGKRYASITYFQGFCPAEGWDSSIDLNEMMEADGYSDMMESVATAMELMESAAKAMQAVERKLKNTDEDAPYCDGDCATCEVPCPDTDYDDSYGWDEYEEYDEEEDDDFDPELKHCLSMPSCNECEKHLECYPEEESKVENIRREVLREAEKCVCGDREQDYGSPEKNFARIANLWAAYKGVNFDEVDVAAMLSLLKIARIASGNPKRDNWVDLAGYAACGAELEANL